MSRAVLIQHATPGPHMDMLNLCVQIHEAYCKRHGIDYRNLESAELHTEGRKPHWTKVALIRLAIQFEYEHIFWLDSDCLIVGDEDLRNACPSNGIGMAWHSLDWGKMGPTCYDHWNVGAMYLTNTLQVREFVDEWWNWPEHDHPWPEQHSLNELAKVRPGIVQTIPHKWNSTPPYFEWKTVPEHPYMKDINAIVPNPEVVRAWHGIGQPHERVEIVRSAVENLQAGGPGHECPTLRAKIRAQEIWQEHKYGLRKKRLEECRETGGVLAHNTSLPA